jgi:hypothetical protein
MISMQPLNKVLYSVLCKLNTKLILFYFHDLYGLSVHKIRLVDHKFEESEIRFVHLFAGLFYL